MLLSFSLVFSIWESDSIISFTSVIQFPTIVILFLIDYNVIKILHIVIIIFFVFFTLYLVPFIFLVWDYNLSCLSQRLFHGTLLWSTTQMLSKLYFGFNTVLFSDGCSFSISWFQCYLHFFCRIFNGFCAVYPSLNMERLI